MAIVGRAKYTRVRESSISLRVVSPQNFTCTCISSAPQLPSPKLETTRSLVQIVKFLVTFFKTLAHMLSANKINLPTHSHIQNCFVQ